MKMEYRKPGMMVTYYNAEDKVNNLVANNSAVIGLANNNKTGRISSQSFTLHR